ncbi:hypothetical protein FQA47_002267 [Oryzias melastigma]|uniref:Uncharacterized protein n=1 Tax=Oryzias melastigma TaxID=30732 RepID=A0A834BV92_ORYME|nr:hypothetical protein FQA47_002267 [Oryzias melastigma]
MNGFGAGASSPDELKDVAGTPCCQQTQRPVWRRDAAHLQLIIASNPNPNAVSSPAWTQSGSCVDFHIEARWRISTLLSVMILISSVTRLCAGHGSPSSSERPGFFTGSERRLTTTSY